MSSSLLVAGTAFLYLSWSFAALANSPSSKLKVEGGKTSQFLVPKLEPRNEGKSSFTGIALKGTQILAQSSLEDFSYEPGVKTPGGLSQRLQDISSNLQPATLAQTRPIIPPGTIEPPRPGLPPPPPSPQSALCP